MYDVIVIGAGPSGMMTSIVASNRGLKVLLIDKNKEVGNKLKLTGGGRCNLTNLKNTNELVNIIHNGKTLYPSLSEFGSNEICDFFKKADIELQKEDNDRIFTKSGKSIEIINALKSMLSNVKIMYETEVLDIVFSDIKEVVTTNGTFKSKKIVIATGGKSYPKTGSTGDGYKFAKKAGHTISMLLPAETYVNTKNNFELAGLTIDVKIKYEDKQSTGSMLFTHKGLSGPAIFNLSEHIYLALLNSKEETINIDFLPSVKMEELSNNFKKELGSTEARIWLKKYLPTKLSEYILGDLKNIKLASISKKNIDIILNNIKNMEVVVIKTGSLEEAIVTSGGVSILEINSSTMESKKVSGLYFAGEVLDLHGPMGGYNLTIAFSTGYKVGKSI